MSHSDVGTNPSPERSFELSELDELGLTLRDALDLLDDRQTTPSYEGVSFENFPYGRFGEARVSCFLTIDHGQASGSIGFYNPNNEDESLYIDRRPNTTAWRLKNGQVATNRGLIRLLHRSWPMFSENEDLALYATMEDPLDCDLTDCITKTLAVHANDSCRERIYEYKNQRMDEANAVLTEVFRLKRTDAAGLTKIHGEIEIPYQVNGISTLVTCTVASDELGSTTLTAHYFDPESNSARKVPIQSEDVILEEFRSMTAQLLDEKLLNASSL